MGNKHTRPVKFIDPAAHTDHAIFEHQRIDPCIGEHPLPAAFDDHREIFLPVAAEIEIDAPARQRRIEHAALDDFIAASETAWYARLSYRQDVGPGRRWTFDYRYEVTGSELASRRYVGHRYEAEYRLEATPADEVRFGLAFRPRRYAERIIELDMGTGPRSDTRWNPEVSWIRRLSGNTSWALEYSLDRRSSTQASKRFSAHRIASTVSWRTER